MLGSFGGGGGGRMCPRRSREGIGLGRERSERPAAARAGDTSGPLRARRLASAPLRRSWIHAAAGLSERARAGEWSPGCCNSCCPTVKWG